MSRKKRIAKHFVNWKYKSKKEKQLSKNSGFNWKVFTIIVLALLLLGTGTYVYAGSAQSSCGDDNCPATCAAHEASCSDVGCTLTRSICSLVGCALPSTYCPSGWQGPPNPYAYSCVYQAQCLPTPFLCQIQCIASTCGDTSCPSGWGSPTSTPSCDDTYEYCSWSDNPWSDSLADPSAVNEDSGANDNIVTVATINTAFRDWDYDHNLESCTIASETGSSVIDCSVDGSYNVDCTTQANQSGSNIVTLNCCHPGPLCTDMDPFTVTVNAVNDAPWSDLIANPSSINEDSGLNNDIVSVATINTAFNDVEDNPSDVTSCTIGSQSDNSMVNCVVDGSYNVDCTTVANKSGSNTVTLNCCDSGASCVNMDPFTVTVNAVNDAPWIDPIVNTTTITEDSGVQPLSTNINASSYFRDVEDDQTPVNMTIITNTSNVDCYMFTDVNFSIFCNPVNNFTGAVNLNLTGWDSGDGGIVQQDFVIIVNSVNDAPWWNEIGNSTAMNLLKNEGTNSIGINASLYWLDVEDGQAVNNITISTNTTNFDCFMNTDNNFTIFCTPPTNFVGDFIITLNGTDSSYDSAIESFEGYVLETNNAPVCNVSEWTNKTLDEDTSIDVDTDMSLYTDSESTINCSDPDGDTLTYSFDSNPDNVFVITNNGNLSVQGTNNVTGEVLARLSVTDQTVYVYFDINATLNAVNDAPWWNETANDTYSYSEDFGIDYTVWDEDGLNNTFGDPDTEDNHLPYDCTVEVNDTNTIQNVEYNGSIIADSRVNVSGVAIITVNCSDTGGLSELTSFEITINSVDDIPWWDLIGNATAADITEDSGEQPLGNDFNVSTYFRDVENDKTPDNITVNTNETSIDCSIKSNFTLFCTPSNNFTGDFIIILNGTDNGNAQVHESFEGYVTAINDAPWWNTISNATARSLSEDSGEQPLGSSGNDLNASSYWWDVEDGQAITSIGTGTNTSDVSCSVKANFSVFCTPVNNFTGNFIVTLNGSDSNSPPGWAMESFEVTIDAINDAPWWNETFNTTYAYGENFGNDYTIWDEDGLNNTYWDIENEGENHLPHNCTAETNDTNIITNVRYNSSVIADSIANITGNAILTINCSDNSEESAVTNFEITINHVNDAPFPVLLDTPLNETNYTVIPEFNWSNTTDLDNDAIYYILQIGSDPSFAEPVSYYNGSIKETENTTGDVSVGNSLTTGGNYFWRVASTDLQDNSSEWSEVRSFTFTPPSVPGPEAPSGGGGGGGAAGGRYAPPSLELSQSLVKATIKQGETKTVELKIKNPSDTTRTVSIDLQDLKKFVLLSETSFTLKPYEEKIITLDFTASSTEPSEVHTGKIIIKTESGQQIVRLILEVLERKALFDIILKVPEEFKKVQQGEEVEADIVLYNLGDLMPVDVTLSYAIKDFENNTIEFKQETFAVEEQTKLKRKIKIPEYLKPDFYTFYTLVEYNGQRAVSSDVFEVEEKVEKKSPWGEFFKRYETVFITGLLILVIIIFSIMLSYMIIKTREVYFKKEEPKKPPQIIEIDEFLNKIEKEKIEEYIKQKLKEGYTEKRIIEAARKSGWNEKLVKSLLEEAKTKPDTKQ